MEAYQSSIWKTLYLPFFFKCFDLRKKKTSIKKKMKGKKQLVELAMCTISPNIWPKKQIW
jgi:hypothetical protein